MLVVQCYLEIFAVKSFLGRENYLSNHMLAQFAFENSKTCATLGIHTFTSIRCVYDIDIT
jgi:hypothetical protein